MLDNKFPSYDQVMAQTPFKWMVFEPLPLVLDWRWSAWASTWPSFSSSSSRPCRAPWLPGSPTRARSGWGRGSRCRLPATFRSQSTSELKKTSSTHFFASIGDAPDFFYGWRWKSKCVTLRFFCAETRFGEIENIIQARLNKKKVFNKPNKKKSVGENVSGLQKVRSVKEPNFERKLNHQGLIINLLGCWLFKVPQVFGELLTEFKPFLVFLPLRYFLQTVTRLGTAPVRIWNLACLDK